MDEKLNNLGLSGSAILLMGYTKAKQDQPQRITDCELQHPVSTATAHPGFRDDGQAFLPASYLNTLTLPKYRKAFT